MPSMFTPNHDQLVTTLPKIAMTMKPRCPNESAPARVQDDRVPEDDEKRAVFLRIPSPETAPRLIGPDAAENRPDKTEEGRETNDPVDHAGKRSRRGPIERRRERAPHDVGEGEKSSKKSRGITERDTDNMRRQPAVRVEHGTHHFHGVAVHRKSDAR